MAVSLSPFAGAGWQFFDNNGVILSGGKLYTYAAGTTSLATTYTSSTGSTANTNPIILNSSGRLANEIWLTIDLNYKFILKTSADVLIGTWDNIPAGTSDVSQLQAALAASTGSSLVGYLPSGTSAVATTVQAKLREIVSRADTGGTAKELIEFKAGGSSSDTVVINSSINDAANNLSAASITGGGSTNDENYLGFGKNRSTFTSTGTVFTWPYLPTNNDLSNLRIFKLSAYRVQTVLTSPSDYTAIISGSQVNITLASALTSGEQLIVEDKAAKVLYTGTAPSYGWIGGGYDNIVENGVMQCVNGAHHRILGGDHGTIFGGSYGIINAGSYGAIFGGTNNVIGSGGGVASAVLGGYRNLASGATSTVVGGQENVVSGAQAASIGGYRNSVSGTASFVSGRNNSVSGSDSAVFGNGNTTSGNYSFVVGYQNTISNNNSYAKGYNSTSSWQGQDIRFGYRDANPLWPQRQHFFIDLAQYTTSTTSAKLQLLDASTAITPPVSTVWKCRLQVSARGGNLKGATFTAEFSIQRDATTTTLIGSVDYTSKVDAGMGTLTNAANISVAIASNAIEVTVQPRVDVAVATKWHGILEVVEVN